MSSISICLQLKVWSKLPGALPYEVIFLLNGMIALLFLSWVYSPGQGKSGLADLFVFSIHPAFALNLAVGSSLTWLPMGL